MGLKLNESADLVFRGFHNVQVQVGNKVRIWEALGASVSGETQLFIREGDTWLILGERLPNRARPISTAVDRELAPILSRRVEEYRPTPMERLVDALPTQPSKPKDIHREDVLAQLAGWDACSPGQAWAYGKTLRQVWAGLKDDSYCGWRTWLLNTLNYHMRLRNPATDRFVRSCSTPDEIVEAWLLATE